MKNFRGSTIVPMMFLVLVAPGCAVANGSARDGSATHSQPGIEIDLTNETRHDMVLADYSVTGGSFVDLPPDELLQDESRVIRFAPVVHLAGPMAFELSYLIEETGTFFEVDFSFVEPSDTALGNTNYLTQNRGLARAGFAIETDPPFDPSKRFQRVQTTFTSMQEKYGVNVVVVNSTDVTMTAADSQLEWGKWTAAPPPQIGSGSFAEITARGRDSSWSGAEGFFTYSIDDANEPEVKVSFDAPFSGDGYFTVSATGSGAGNYNYAATEFDPSKDFNTVTLTISRKAE